ncbi:MAG TPA: hypothetical protein VMV14_05700 [Acidimicrobiales bacterium]|nr:hypothetical protein [Acidimicrobiales bacterium]
MDGTNLILDWEATSERAILLALSLPLGVWKHKGQPSIDWRRPVQLDDTGLRFESSDEGLEVPPRFEIGEDEEGEEA